MENRRRARALGSGRPSSRFNPITGVDYEEDSQPVVPTDQMRATNVGVPMLNLADLGDSERRVPVDRQSPVDSVISTLRSCDGMQGSPSAAGGDDYDSELFLGDRRWTFAPYSELNLSRPAETLEEKGRSEQILNTVMVDQLSRAVISDPAQDSGRSFSGDKLYHQPGQPRGAIRRLHQTKLQSGSASELLLSERVRFGARLLSRIGCDAVRELTGFFFNAENSLTIYEYKQFGKTSKALPLVARGTYNHLHGRRKHSPYTLADIRTRRRMRGCHASLQSISAIRQRVSMLPKNNTLYFCVGGQKSLPQSARSTPELAVRICEVDMKAKADIILSGARQSNEESVWNDFHQLSDEEYKDLAILNCVQGKVRAMTKKRGVKTLMGIQQELRKRDRQEDGRLDVYELEQILKDYHIVLASQELKSMWSVLDDSQQGVVDSSLFLRSFFGEMHEHSKAFVRKAFHKLDPQHKGDVSVSQMSMFFNVTKHPWVRSGLCSEVGLREEFLAIWSAHQIVSYTLFEIFYEGLNIDVDNDEEFIDILVNSWSLGRSR